MAKKRKTDFEVIKAPEKSPSKKKPISKVETNDKTENTQTSTEEKSTEEQLYCAIKPEEITRLLKADEELRKLTRENAVIIETWLTSDKGIRIPSKKIVILSLDQAMVQISILLKQALMEVEDCKETKNTAPISIKPEPKKNLFQKLFNLKK